MEDFNLSLKYIPIRNLNGILPCDVYKEEDVKQFIKILKSEMVSEVCRVWESKKELNPNIVIRRIDNIVGDRLK